MADDERATPIGLAALAVAISLVEELCKRGVLDRQASVEIMRNANVYVQAFGADLPSGVEEETRRILDSISKVPGEAAGVTG